MHLTPLLALLIGIDDFAEIALLISGVSALASFVTGLLSFLRNRTPGRIDVKLQDGSVLTLSKSMSSSELATKISEIQGRLESFEREKSSLMDKSESRDSGAQAKSDN